MKKEELKNLIIETISNIGVENDIEDVKGADRLKDDLYKDSLDFVEFVMHIESSLSISIPDHEIEGKGNDSIDELTDYIFTKIG